MKSISVIIPAYNTALWIEDCIKSIISQSCDATIEIIVVDDGSTDDTPTILSKFKKKYPDTLKIITQPRRGQSVARNKAIEKASGESFIFVDADDTLLPGAVETLLTTFRNTHSPIVCASYLRRPKTGSSHSGKVRTLDYHTAIRTLLYQSDYSINSSLWGKLFDRKLFDGLRLWEGHIYEDLDIMPRLFLRAGTVSVVDAPVYFYRRNPDSTLSVWNDRRKDMLDVTQRIIDIPEISSDPLLRAAALDRSFSAACNCLINMHRYNDRDSATRERCHAMIKAARQYSLFSRHARLKNRLTAIISTIFF